MYRLSPYFRSILYVFLPNLRFSASPYFNQDALMHNALQFTSTGRHMIRLHAETLTFNFSIK